jgi:hypothetical protein
MGKQLRDECFGKEKFCDNLLQGFESNLVYEKQELESMERE